MEAEQEEKQLYIQQQQGNSFASNSSADSSLPMRFVRLNPRFDRQGTLDLLQVRWLEEHQITYVISPQSDLMRSLN
jgi:hypothetical protein